VNKITKTVIKTINIPLDPVTISHNGMNGSIGQSLIDFTPIIN
jgi:hypothetical protein